MTIRTTIRWFTMAVVAVTLMLALAQTAPAVTATGGTVTEANGYRIHTFTNSGTLTVTAGGNVEVLVVAGGGGGGQTIGGGGGAGGFVTNASYSVSASNYAVTVGAGGAGAPTNDPYTSGGGTNGSNSIFGSLTAYGGGSGGNYNNTANGASAGGSGGGTGAGCSGGPMAGTNGQGNAGGTTAANQNSGAGGGGAGATGENATSGTEGAGGAGLSSDISGASTFYAGGGGGGARNPSGGGGGAGGNGGGGAGSSTNGANASANTGGGGGGGGYLNTPATQYAGGAGGSGIVIVRYYLPTPFIENRPATNVTATSAWLNGFLVNTGSAPVTAVSAYWGDTDGGTPTSGLWQATNALVDAGAWTNGAFLICQATGLVANQYYYRYYATNSFGHAWAASSEYFLAGNVTVTNTDPFAMEPPPGMPATNTGTLTIQRDTSATNEALTVYYAWSGTATNGLDYTPLPAGASVTMFAGMANTNITIVPLWSGVWSGTRTVWLTLQPGAYVIGSPASNVVTITNCIVTPGAIVTTNAGNWNDGAIWSLGRRPVAGDDVTVKHAVVLSNATECLSSFAITNAILTFTNWSTTLTASNVTIHSGGQLTLPDAFTESQMSNRVHIVCTNFTLATNGTIDAEDKGYAGGDGISGGYGPGGGPPTGGHGCGAGYGGKGGMDVYNGTPGGSTYGSTNAPVDPGSGGSARKTGEFGGDGGGAVQIEATGNVTVYGTITADGGNGVGCAGGGSGGGIYITCNTFGGSTSGLLSADGGTGYGGRGGGGGRIAVIYNLAAQTNRPGIRFSTNHGGATTGAEIGTVYLPNTVSFLLETLTDELFMDVLLVVPGFTNWSPGSLTMSNCVVTFAEQGFRLNVTNGVLFGSGASLTLLRNSRLSCGGNMTLTNGGSLYVYSGITNAANPDYGALVNVAGDVFVGANSWVYPYSEPTNGGSVKFQVKNLAIANGGGFNAIGKGYAGGDGTSGGYGPGGAPHGSGWGSGGGYGGKGATDPAYGSTPGGSTYGSTNAPLDPGSGGSARSPEADEVGGAGGGLVWIEATNNVTVNGTITADGGNGIGCAGGGSGGGIYITCNTFGGSISGLLTANGGNGVNGGGGGGGRIAVWYEVPESDHARILAGDMKRVVIITNATEYKEFLGTVSVTNGTGGTDAEPGTIVFLTVTPPSGTIFMCQ